MSESIHIPCPYCQTINRIPADKLAANPTCGKCKNRLITGSPIELNESDFARYIQKSDLPVVVDFWAPWCGPCKMMAPAYAEAAAQLSPQVILAKVNTEQNQSLAAQYNIRSIPTIAIFNNGRELTRQAGATDAPTMVRWIRQHAA